MSPRRVEETDYYRGGMKVPPQGGSHVDSPLTPERPHEDDSYGGCVTCREYVSGSGDDEHMVSVPFPCPTVRLRAALAEREAHIDRERLARAIGEAGISLWHPSWDARQCADAILARLAASLPSEEPKP